MKRDLDLALIGNGAIGLLVDSSGAVVWGCFPRFDSDATFCALLDNPEPGEERGIYAIELVGMTRTEQQYVTNTAVLVTRIFDDAGGAIEITDCVPRFFQHGRLFQPVTLVRRVQRIMGSPRIVIRLRPAFNYGAERPVLTVGSNHIRYVMPELTLRLTTDTSLTALIEERPLFLDEAITLVLGPDESPPTAVADIGRRFIEETQAYWRDWVRRLAIPFEWQGAVIRAAITLQLNSFDDTGAIIAAMTTSIPEAAGSSRNWDYRFCWLRDAYFVVDALNRLGATDTMERYLGYIVNIAAGADRHLLQPVYRINGSLQLDEAIVPSLPGYRGMGPVRVGNQAYTQVQHDVYGSAILAATHVFFDERLTKRGDLALFERLEVLGRHALVVFDRPDAGIWELRERLRVHTFPSVMCWAACDRLARIAARLGLVERATRVARRRRSDPRVHPRSLLEPRAQQLRRRDRFRCAGRQPVAPGRYRLHQSRRSALCRHRRRDRVGTDARRLHFSLRRNRRLRPAGERLHRVHVLVRQRPLRARPPRRGTGAVRKAARPPQPAWPSLRARRYRDGRTLGQLCADLQHGRLDHLGDQAVAAVGRGVLAAEPATDRLTRRLMSSTYVKTTGT